MLNRSRQNIQYENMIFFWCNYCLLNEYFLLYFLFFKNTFKTKKQRSITANPARKLRVESAEYPRINSLRDKTAIRIRAIPMIGIIDFDKGFFIGGLIEIDFDMKSDYNYWPNGFWLLQLIFSPGETLKYLQKYL